jgi:hypothetical protein
MNERSPRIQSRVHAIDLSDAHKDAWRSLGNNADFRVSQPRRARGHSEYRDNVSRQAKREFRAARRLGKPIGWAKARQLATSRVAYITNAWG